VRELSLLYPVTGPRRWNFEMRRSSSPRVQFALKPFEDWTSRRSLCSLLGFGPNLANRLDIRRSKAGRMARNMVKEFE
jgi:hypothetical protein